MTFQANLYIEPFWATARLVGSILLFHHLH